MLFVTIAILILLIAGAVLALRALRSWAPTPSRRGRGQNPPGNNGHRRRDTHDDGYLAYGAAAGTTWDDTRRRRDGDADHAPAHSSARGDGPSWGAAHRSGGSWDDGPSSSSDSGGGGSDSSSGDSGGSSVD